MEIELIGPLSKKAFYSIQQKIGVTNFERKERVSIMFFKDKIPFNIDKLDDPVDLRLRITNGKGELVLKYGDFSENAVRDEISIPFEKQNLSEMIRFLKYLNWTKSVVYKTIKYNIAIDDYELSLVDIEGFGYNFEIEILKYESIEHAKKRLDEIRKEYDFRPFKEKEFELQCNTINSKEEFQIDFSDKQYNEIDEIVSRIIN